MERGEDILQRKGDGVSERLGGRGREKDENLKCILLRLDAL